MPYKGGPTEAFQGLVKDDPEINVTTEDLENGQQFRNLKGDGRLAWDEVWTEFRVSLGPCREQESFRVRLPRPGRALAAPVFVTPLVFLLALSFGYTDDLGEAIYSTRLDDYERLVDPPTCRCCSARSASPSPPSCSAPDRLSGRLLHRHLRRPLEERADRAGGAAVLRQLPHPHLRLDRTARRRRDGQRRARLERAFLETRTR